MSGACADSYGDQQVWQGAYCALNDPVGCCGICPNTDLSGLGVRLAFYLQSVMNVILVCVSPEDSTQGAWSATVLTISLVIPAMVLKYQQGITLHHATLALNFATFSALASLAVAPRCSIWRKEMALDDNNLTSREKRAKLPTALKVQHRGRVILSVALLMQVSLQWIWAIILFTHPWYSQTDCSGSTILVFFGASYTAHDINHGHYAIWPCWLIFSLSVTFVWGVILVISSASAAHDRPAIAVDNEAAEHDKKYWTLSLFGWHEISFERDAERVKIWIGHFMAFLIGLMYLTVSEMQIAKNNILPGENQLGSFGSTAALLLAVAPAWAVVVALYKLIPASPDPPTDILSPTSPTSPRLMRGLTRFLPRKQLSGDSSLFSADGMNTMHVENSQAEYSRTKLFHRGPVRN
ncbi:hypothetical protein BOTBODRAFT_303248 [Botryobasidium botryosum FD-172 SS1]|uniref:Uncharacterized protein n=1 Tax=Botryobasidium botryosum (strain FD-172 SS1) TaxID=930990 RepID=A0A067MK77_BOTB1|nr:hypothetical protein BOTBODRAFT_303248 [Botryobasidium botryosum FD-172 SS1]